MKIRTTISEGGRRAVLFDLDAAMKAAFDIQWRQKVEMAAKYPRAGRYVVATDIENQVRVLAQDTLDGKPWGSSDPAWGRGGHRVRIVLSRPGTVLDACRAWLFAQVRAGKLTAHNFGRGHISGERFRPAGEEMTEAERKTTAAREARIAGTAKPKPVHYAVSWGRPECSRDRRSRYGPPNRYVRTTTRPKDVTCPRCLKMLADGRAPMPYRGDEVTS